MFKAPLVVGYKGEIGSFLLQGLLRIMPKASDIWCYDKEATAGEAFDRLEKADVVFLCVPIQETASWIQKHHHQFWKREHSKVLIEQTSLKDPLRKEFRDLPILSMHVLFRPSATPNPQDRCIALIQHPLWKTYAPLIQQMTQASLIYYNSIQEHDREMALQQALTHRLILILNSLYERQRLPIGKTYISQQVQALAHRIQQGDRVLYQTIQSNRFLSQALRALEKQLRQFDITKQIQG